jgi:hypothetical protein
MSAYTNKRNGRQNSYYGPTPEPAPQATEPAPDELRGDNEPVSEWRQWSPSAKAILHDLASALDDAIANAGQAAYADMATSQPETYRERDDHAHAVLSAVFGTWHAPWPADHDYASTGATRSPMAYGDVRAFKDLSTWRILHRGLTFTQHAASIADAAYAYATRVYGDTATARELRGSPAQDTSGTYYAQFTTSDGQEHRSTPFNVLIVKDVATHGGA